MRVQYVAALDQRFQGAENYITNFISLVPANHYYLNPPPQQSLRSDTYLSDYWWWSLPAREAS